MTLPMSCDTFVHGRPRNMCIFFYDLPKRLSYFGVTLPWFLLNPAHPHSSTPNPYKKLPVPHKVTYRFLWITFSVVPFQFYAKSIAGNRGLQAEACLSQQDKFSNYQSRSHIYRIFLTELTFTYGILNFTFNHVEMKNAQNNLFYILFQSRKKKTSLY